MVFLSQRPEWDRLKTGKCWRNTCAAGRCDYVTGDIEHGCTILLAEEDFGIRSKCYQRLRASLENGRSCCQTRLMISHVIRDATEVVSELFSMK